MVKLLLLSILFATALVPALAARVEPAGRALRALTGTMLLAEIGYAAFLLFLYHRLI